MKRQYDDRGRRRNTSLNLRLSPEENTQLMTEAALAGMTRQQYVLERVKNKSVVVLGNPRVYKALKDQFAAVLGELRRVEAGTGVDPDLMDTIRMMTAIMGGMKEDADGT